MARSLKKPPFVGRDVYRKLKSVLDRDSSTTGRNGFDTKSRATTILPEMIGLTIGIHNGMSFVQVFII